MKLVVGLGNPGSKYVGTRHNVGFLVLDRLAGDREWKKSERGQLKYLWLEEGGEAIELIKPQTMMNSSGKALVYARRKHPKLKLSDLYIVHDDLDIGLGEYKIQLGKGPRQHKGLESIYDHLGSKEFWHVRIGIENRIQNPGSRILKIPGEEYVLQRFNPEEREVVDRVIREVVDNLFARLLHE